MIVPMKKYSFLVYHREYEKFLTDLQGLGVVHIIEKGTGDIENEELRERYAEINEIANAIKFLEKRSIEDETTPGKANAKEILAELKNVQKDYDSNIALLDTLNKEHAVLKPWGEFDWNNIGRLSEAGLKARLMISSAKVFEDSGWSDKYFVETIQQAEGNVYFVLFHKLDEIIEIDAEEAHLPSKSLSEVSKQIDEANEAIAKAEEVFDNYAKQYIPVLTELKERLNGELSFELVKLNTQKEAENKLMVFEGWAPEDKVEELDKFLNNSGVYFENSSPDIKEAPPIKLKNNSFAKLYEAIGELYTFPNYKELDLTPFFAPFYMLFFGFCLGDAGYGLLITLGTIYGLFKVKDKFKPLLKLGIFLGISTTIMGAIGGTLFGINLIDSGYTLTSHSIEVLQSSLPAEVSEKLASIQDLHFNKKDEFIKKVSSVISNDELKEYQQVILKHTESDYPVLNSFRYLLWDSNTLMMIALAIGYIQVLFGMFIKAANKARMYGFKYSVSQLGWNLIVMVTIPVFAMGNFNVIPSDTANKFALISLIIGGIPAIFYNTPGKNPILNLGVGLWDTYQTASGLLGDVLSYIRLFALGISSAILGNVFNTLAIELSPETVVVRQLVMILILAFGHSLNFFMAALGSFVHPLRLTFVEFYKNAGFMGGGSKYEPFRK